MPLSSVGASLPGRREMMSPSTRRLTGKLTSLPSRYVHCKDTAGKDGTNRSSVSFSQSGGGRSEKSTAKKKNKKFYFKNAALKLSGVCIWCVRRSRRYPLRSAATFPPDATSPTSSAAEETPWQPGQPGGGAGEHSR